MEETTKTKTRRNTTQNRNRWNEKIVQISRVTKVCKGGKKLSFRVVIVIGNENGKVGVGIGKADDVVNAITKATNVAKQKIVSITTTRNKTIPHVVYGNFGASKILLKPANDGTGVIAGSSIRTVLELAGIKNISAKQLGSNNLLNNAQATIQALLKLKTIKIISEERNKPIESFYKNLKI